MTGVFALTVFITQRSGEHYERVLEYGCPLIVLAGAAFFMILIRWQDCEIRLKERTRRLLDIGCGWGFLLIEAARKYGVKGYGCTLSEEQWKKGQERIKEYGLEGQVEIELIDYRDVAASRRTFDRIVSIGMLEHVGRPNFPLYMEDASDMLKDGGLFLLHYISDPSEKETSAWIRKYIFPGGCLPSLREMVSLAYDYDMNVIDVESLRYHYYKTLMHWYNNFQGVREQVEAKRGSEFVRMWDLYLCGCAAGFYIGNMDLHQILMTKGVTNELPLTRWY